MQLVAAAVLFSVGLASFACVAAERDTSATFTVDPSASPRTAAEMLGQVHPIIAISAVDPAASDCKGKDCGPSVQFFVSNPSLAGAKDISVQCSVRGSGGEQLAQGSTTVQVASSQAAIGRLTFVGADYAVFSKVMCDIAR